MSAKSTPGPWILQGESTDYVRVGTDIEGMFTVAKVSGFSLPEARANAKLIAAAPALADALLKMWENFDSHIHGGKSVHPTLETAQAARAALRAAGRIP